MYQLLKKVDINLLSNLSRISISKHLTLFSYKRHGCLFYLIKYISVKIYIVKKCSLIYK